MEQDEHITAWVTTWALTRGILRVNGRVCHNISSKMLSFGQHGCAHGKDWHRTPAAAVARAQEMRKDKIASLRKSIKKLESMTFFVELGNIETGESHDQPHPAG